VADYERTTTKTTLERLPAAIRAALSERSEPALLSVPYHIGLGPPDGDAARAALEEAIRAAKA
jgi:hypothetical protein